MSSSPVFPPALPPPPMPAPSSSRSTVSPAPALASTLQAEHARFKALPDILHPASATELSAGTLAHAERVRAALARANYDGTSPHWGRVHSLAKLTCTRSLRLTPYIPPTPAPPSTGKRYLLAETEEEWLAWEADQQRARTGNDSPPGWKTTSQEEVAKTKKMGLEEKVERWKSNLVEPSQMPAPPLSPTLARAPVAKSQSRLSFTAEKRTAVSAQAKGGRKPSRRPNRNNKAGDDVSTSGPQAPSSAKPAPATSKGLTNSQLSGLSSPPITPSKNKGKGKAQAVDEDPSACVELLAEPPVADDEEDPYAEQPIPEPSPPSFLPKRPRPLTPPEEGGSDEPLPKRAKRVVEAGAVTTSMPPPPVKERKIKAWASNGTIPGLAQTQSTQPSSTPLHMPVEQPVLESAILPPQRAPSSIPRPATPPPAEHGQHRKVGDAPVGSAPMAPPSMLAGAPFSPPPRFTQNPDLFAPGETSVLGDRAPSLPPASGPFASVPGAATDSASDLPSTFNAPAPGTFTQDPDLFAPRETSVLGARPASPPPSAPALDKIRPGTFTQDPHVFAPAETSIIGARPPSPNPSAVDEARPGRFTQQPGLFNPGETSVLGNRPDSPSRSQHVAPRMSFGSLNGAGSIPGLGMLNGAGSVPEPLESAFGGGAQGQARSSSGGTFQALEGGTWQTPVSPMDSGMPVPDEPDHDQEEPSPALPSFPLSNGSRASAYPYDSYNKQPSNRSIGLSDLGGPAGGGFMSGFGADGSGDLYCSQLDAQVEEDVGEASRLLERDVEYEKWLVDEEKDDEDPLQDGQWEGSSQEVMAVVGM
jgi:hypothetical protein